jgi:hypothetical protein
LIDRGKRKRHVSQQADVAQNLDRKFQELPPGPLGARTDCTPRRHKLHIRSRVPAHL